jgi:hypothetical protein
MKNGKELGNFINLGGEGTKSADFKEERGREAAWEMFGSSSCVRDFVEAGTRGGQSARKFSHIWGDQGFFEEIPVELQNLSAANVRIMRFFERVRG